MKKTFNFIVLFLLAIHIYSQELTAKKVFEEAMKKENPDTAILYVQNEIDKISAPAEKRSLLIFLGTLQEMTSNFSAARNSYSKAAGIAARDAEDMQKKSTEQLVIDAVRCALSMGDYENAERFLNSSVRSSKNPTIQAYIKLYEQWANLSKAENTNQMEETISMLKAYLSLPSMEAVKPSILLTLWYITGEETFALSLQKEFPSSAEYGITSGRIQILPTPFWFFLPRKTHNLKTISTNTEVLESKTVYQEIISKPEEQVSEKAKKLQLGLFKEKENAERFIQRVNSKGFKSYIQEEIRKSGTKYYSVVIDENSNGTLSQELRTAGFDCHPIF